MIGQSTPASDAADPVREASAGPAPAMDAPVSPAVQPDEASPVEMGGGDGPDRTRYGDWEKNGRCIDF